LMDSKYRERHDAEVGEEALHSFVVGLLHELDQDAIVEDAITLLALNALDISPVFVVTVHVGEVRAALLVSKVGRTDFLYLLV
jgi:hypothetical protein